MKAADLISRARAAGRTGLSEQEGKALLAEYGIPVPRSLLVPGSAGVEAGIAGFTPPYVVKVASQDILHKSDVGGVAVGLPDAVAVCAAIEEMARNPAIAGARVDGYLVEEMAAEGREVVIGGLWDVRFGPMVMVGLGGIFIELLQDVSFRLCPISEGEAVEMLEELRGYPLLEGQRGQTGIAVRAIVDALLRIGGERGLLIEQEGAIDELDINPLIVSPKGAVAADARIILSSREARGDSTGSRRAPGAQLPVAERFRPLFEPKTIAVVGASANGTRIANTFIRRMKDFGYKGKIYPIHPEAPQVESLAACPSLAETPEPIDYAYIAIGAGQIPDLLANTNGNVRFAQVISSGFREIADGAALESELVDKAHAGGCRVIGPNCLGIYSPRGGVTFPVDAPREAGPVGVISQSGGLGTDIIKRGQWRGLRFSSLVTVGNCADVGPVELLEYYFADPQTRVIGMYLEDVRDGRAFFNLLRSANATKPVVLLIGGLSRQGRTAAASHTGALAAGDRSWHALVRQTPSVMVATVDEFIDTLLALQYLRLRPRRPTRQVALFGNGGGSGVLATDGFAALGLEVLPFPEVARERLEAMQLPPGTSVVNPIDAPVGTLQEQNGRIANTILDIVYSLAKPDALVMHLNLAAFVGRGEVDPVDNLIQAAVGVQTGYPGQAHFLMALRVDGSPELEEAKRNYTAQALAAGIPVYDELDNIARVLAAIRHLEMRMAGR
ncbi:MAG: acetate--CoA ligase family protein [SAR324 cluster bacterium]|nr:acetate--CoA ligase family protein [SAR324 cluster bacterium]